MAARSRGGKNRHRAKTDVIEVTIDRLGAQGDGVASHDHKSVFVAFAAPGDRVRVAKPAQGKSGPVEVIERLEDGPVRRVARCSHFEQCGGCSIQHIEDDLYRDWKSKLLKQAFSRRDLDESVIEPMVACAPATRRRVRLHVRQTAIGPVLGFLGPRSNLIVPVKECPVTRDRIVSILVPLRELLASILGAGERAEVSILDTDDGLDITFHLKQSPEMDAREKLARFAETLDIARLSRLPVNLKSEADTEAEPIIVRRTPILKFGESAVTIPPGGFAQATSEGEQALRQVVVDAMPDSKKIVDLYSGCGAFSLPLAEGGANVHAIDQSDGQIKALLSAARSGGIGNLVSAEARDLERRPLIDEELSAFDGVVLDPPRIGAERQISQLAGSEIPVIVYVSCNPVSFARDAQMLIANGYRMERCLPVDQFLWSPHLELVSVFRKAG